MTDSQGKEYMIKRGIFQEKNFSESGFSFLEQIIQFGPGLGRPDGRIRRGLHSGWKVLPGFEIIARIRGLLIGYILGLALPALVIRRLGIEPAVFAGVERNAAFRTGIVPADPRNGFHGLSAAVASHAITYE
jgi:hypothetical protein